MSGSDTVRLRHMLDAAREATEFGTGRREAIWNATVCWRLR
jgi:hypothetical protein